MGRLCLIGILVAAAMAVIGWPVHRYHAKQQQLESLTSPFLQFVLLQAPLMTAIYVRWLTSRSIIYPHKFTEEASLSRPDW